MDRARAMNALEFRSTIKTAYADVLTPDAIRALELVAHFDADSKQLMTARIRRRAQRAAEHGRIKFLDPGSTIGRTAIKVRDAREGRFTGSAIPRDLQRQWIQGTGPATRPGAPVETGLRNVAYALLSGADGWMFDGEDALGQVGTMSLDNQRNLKLAIDGDAVFLKVAERVAGEMNKWASGFFGKPIVDRKSTRLNSSHSQISYAVFCLKKKKKKKKRSKMMIKILVSQHTI